MQKSATIKYDASKELGPEQEVVITMDLVEVPALPEADGNYQLTVASGVYTWTEIV